MRARADLPIPPKPAGEAPHLFGYGLRERLLLALAVNDRPLYVTELADLLRTNPSKIRQTLMPLERVGLVSSAFARNNLRWVALNSAWPAHIQALCYLRALEAGWSQPRVGKPRRRAERVALSPLRPDPGRPGTRPPSPPPTVWWRATSTTSRRRWAWTATACWRLSRENAGRCAAPPGACAATPSEHRKKPRGRDGHRRGCRICSAKEDAIAH